MAVSRLRIPTLADSVIVLIIPATILFGNSLVGLNESWPWFYYASFYLVVSVLAWLWQVRVALQENELESFAKLAHPLGPLSVIYVGIPFYAVAGWADSHAMLSSTMEMLVAMSAGPAAVLTAWLFFRAWHIAIAHARDL